MRVGALEAELLNILWAHPEPMTAAEVHREVSRTRELAYTTVSTSLQRMAGKGLVHQDRSERAHRFDAVLRREDMIRNLAEEAMGLIGTPPGALVGFLGQLDPHMRSQLRSALDAIDDNTRREGDGRGSH